jgi:hypothetical protein
MKHSVHRFRPERLPNARDYFERQFGQLRRVSRGWARVRCCFHSPDKNPSLDVNIENGSFKCWSCDAHGSGLVGFVMRRDGLSFQRACESLGGWDGAPLQIDEIRIRNQAQQERAQKRRSEVDLERRYFESENWLYCIESIYRDTSTRLSEIRRARVQSDEEEICWSVLALAQDECRDAETEFIRVRCAWPGAPRRATT